MITYDWYSAEGDHLKRQHTWFVEDLGPIAGLVAWTKVFSMDSAARPKDYRQTYTIWREEPYDDWFAIGEDLPKHGFQREWNPARHVDFGRDY